MYALIGIALAAFYGAYQFVTSSPSEGTPSATVPIVFVIIGIVCLIVAALIARNLSKEPAPK